MYTARLAASMSELTLGRLSLSLYIYIYMMLYYMIALLYMYTTPLSSGSCLFCRRTREEPRAPISHSRSWPPGARSRWLRCVRTARGRTLIAVCDKLLHIALAWLVSVCTDHTAILYNTYNMLYYDTISYTMIHYHITYCNMT